MPPSSGRNIFRKQLLSGAVQSFCALQVAERCAGLIRALSQVKPQRSSPEVYDTDHEIFSHPLDALRYLLVNLPQPAAEWNPPDYSGQVMPRIW